MNAIEIEINENLTTQLFYTSYRLQDNYYQFFCEKNLIFLADSSKFNLVKNDSLTFEQKLVIIK